VKQKQNFMFVCLFETHSHFVAKARLELWSPCLSPWVLGLQVCATTPSSNPNHFFLVQRPFKMPVLSRHSTSPSHGPKISLNKTEVHQPSPFPACLHPLPPVLRDFLHLTPGPPHKTGLIGWDCFRDQRAREPWESGTLLSKELGLKLEPWDGCK
jgi:hypothetical protein